jgi:hypothetical protein
LRESRKRIFASAALCVLVVCLGCDRRFTDDLAFQAPGGWIYAAVPAGGELWFKGGGSREMIMAQATESPLPWERRADRTDITICRNHPAVLMVQPNVRGQIWEGVSTTWRSERYMAVYVRPVGLPRDPKAEAAIRTLCLKE